MKHTHHTKHTRVATAFFAVLAASIALALPARAHCDTPEGPVVAAAKLALQKRDVTPALKWVGKDSEKEIRDAFALTLKVRSQGADAQQLADTYFFETLVRVHRAGEGEPYTGLKSAGTIDPVFLAADQSLEKGTVDDLAADVAKAAQEKIRALFAQALEKKKHADESVEAGREYVAAYVAYLHFVESAHSPGAEEK